MAVASANGRARKSLAEQIDRLDSILDGLSDGLTEAVADAVRAALTQALGGPLAEVVKLTAEAAVRDALALHAAEPSQATGIPPSMKVTARTGFWSWLWSRVRPVAARVRELTVAVATWVWAGIGGPAAVAHGMAWTAFLRVRRTVRLTATVARQMWRFRGDCGLALLIGVAIGLGGYLAGPLISALMCGGAGMVLTLAGLVLVPLGRLLTNLDPMRP